MKVLLQWQEKGMGEGRARIQRERSMRATRGAEDIREEQASGTEKQKTVAALQSVNLLRCKVSNYNRAAIRLFDQTFTPHLIEIELNGHNGADFRLGAGPTNERETRTQPLRYCFWLTLGG